MLQREEIEVFELQLPVYVGRTEDGNNLLVRQRGEVFGYMFSGPTRADEELAKVLKGKEFSLLPLMTPEGVKRYLQLLYRQGVRIVHFYYEDQETFEPRTVELEVAATISQIED